MEAHKHCTNCETTLISEYCHHCGQKKSHRITLKHFILHDLVHGIWHFDKGLLYTLRESFLRPGYMAMNYINGKRIRYYNIFYLLLLVLGINVLIAHYFKEYYHIAEEAKPLITQEKNTLNLSGFVDHYFKALLFLFIPFFALSGFLAFRKMKLNFAEHAVIAGNIMLTGAIWFFIFTWYNYLSINITAPVINIIGIVLLSGVLLVPVLVYYQATRQVYKPLGFALRMISWYGWFWLEFFLVLGIVALFTGKTNFRLG